MEASLYSIFSQHASGDGTLPVTLLRSVLSQCNLSLPEELLGGLEAGGGCLTFPRLVQLLESGEGGLDAFLDAAGPELAASQQGGGAAFSPLQPPHPSPSGSAAPLDESADQRVVEFIATLAEYQVQCEVGGNYEEAARCTDQLRRLRTQEEARRVQALKARYVAERTSLSAAQVAQFRDFNASWDTYLSEYDAMATLYIKQLQARHLASLRAHQQELHAELVHKPVKFGREVLDWRAKEANLAKHHKYSEAARIKAVVEELERRERARLDEERLVVFSQREARYRLLQKAELTALQKRIETRRAEHVKQRQSDTARLAQRNKNVMAVLEGRQASEERERIAAIKASLLVPRAALQNRPKLDTGRVKAKPAAFGEGFTSAADLIAQRERAKREAACGGGGGSPSGR